MCIPVKFSTRKYCFSLGNSFAQQLVHWIMLGNKLNKTSLALSKEDQKRQKKFTWILFLLGLIIFALFLAGFILLFK